MKKLYFKTLITTAILALLILAAYYFGFNYFAVKRLNQINLQLSKGTFSYLQNKLKKTPKNQWKSVLTKVQPKNTRPAKIIPINLIKLTKHNKKSLLEGNIIFQSGRDHLFLDYGIDDSFALQRIGQTQYVLKIQLGEPINQIIHGTVRWITHIILSQLKYLPSKNWPTEIEKLEKQFNIPLKIIDIDNPQITNAMHTDLKIYKMSYLKTSNAAPISTLYFTTSNPHKILMLGPIHYSSLSQRYATVEKYYLVLFAGASLLFVLLLTFLFSRNARKIYRITKQFSQGDFETSAKVGKISVLYDIYKNIITMGNQLNQHITTQKNMTRFVAHEVRTPLSTMQLALDALKKEPNFPSSAQQNLVSIQDDIEEINQLISNFLLYYKTSTHDLTPKIKKINITTHFPHP